MENGITRSNQATNSSCKLYLFTLPKSPRGAQLSRARGTGRWGHAEVRRAGILMILVPGGDAGGGVYICLLNFGSRTATRRAETSQHMNKVFELFPGAKLGIAAFTLCLTAASLTAAPKPNSPPTLQPVNLGMAASFAVFGGSGVTCIGKSVITGDLGVYPIAGTAVTGFFTDDGGKGPCKVIGNIQDNDTFPETTAAQHAAASLTIAINDAKGRTGAFTPVGPGTSFVDLGGATLTPGLYTSKSTKLVPGPTGVNA